MKLTMKPSVARRGLSVLGVILVGAIVGAVAVSGRDALMTIVGNQPARTAGAETESAGPTPDALGLTEAEAVAAAAVIAPQTVGREVRVAELGPLSEVFEASSAFDVAQRVPPDRLVWYLYFVGEDGRGTIAVLDYRDGTAHFVRNLR